jgi:hypothetical protein
MAHPSARSAPPAVTLLLALLAACTSATGTRQDTAPGERPADLNAAATSSAPIVQQSRRGRPSPPATSLPAAVPSPRPLATPEPPLSPNPSLRSGPVAIDLFADGDFVSQTRVDWCVPASILTMANMIEADASVPDPMPSQAKLDRRARLLSTDRLVGAGSEPEGWAGTLNELGLGPYVVTSEPTRKRAIATAARAIRLTGRPVGLLIWRGAHAWVMSGFEATADPAWTDDFAVTHIRVEDPWFPRSSSLWGNGQSPDSRIAVANLREDFLPWRRPTVRYPEKDGRFVLVLPVSDPTADRARRAASDTYLAGR